MTVLHVQNEAKTVEKRQTDALCKVDGPICLVSEEIDGNKGTGHVGLWRLGECLSLNCELGCDGESVMCCVC